MIVATVSAIIIIAYVASVYWCWYETELFFSGLSFVKAKFYDVVTCFIPVVNLLAAIIYFVDEKRCPIKFKSFEKITNRFFKSNADK